MSESFVPANELEEKLMLAQSGEMDGVEFVQFLLGAQVFIPVKDNEVIGGLQMSDKAIPLTLQTDDAGEVLILFTSPDRAREFLKEFPDYEGGLLSEFSWILERVGTGIGVSLNPGWPVGIDLESDMLAMIMNQSGVPAE